MPRTHKNVVMGKLPAPVLKALRDYYQSDDPKPDDVVRLLSLHDLFSPKFRVEHDTAIRDLLNVFSGTRKDHVVDNFILGIAENSPSLRAGLSAYSFVINFPTHTFSSDDGVVCKICGEFREVTVDPTFINAIRFQAGCMVGNSPTHLTQFLIEHSRTPRRTPSSLTTLSRILQEIRNASADDTPNTLQRSIRRIPGVQMSVYEARGLLTALGHAGILQSGGHQGLAQAFVNAETAPRKHHSSDWGYPISFWTGADGFNDDALHYWFSSYPKLLDGLIQPR